MVVKKLVVADLLSAITSSERYKGNIEYGSPRRGHGEGTVRAHIAQLEENLATMMGRGLVRLKHYQKLRILIHVHDSFKMESERDVPILHPKSHATIAREFLSQLTDDEDLLNIVQYHDLGYALYRNFEKKGRFSIARLEDGLSHIKDIDLYLLFCIIDACTPSKGRRVIRWFVGEVVARRPEAEVGVDWVLPGPENFGEVF